MTLSAHPSTKARRHVPHRGPWRDPKWWTRGLGRAASAARSGFERAALALAGGRAQTRVENGLVRARDAAAVARVISSAGDQQRGEDRRVDGGAPPVVVDAGSAESAGTQNIHANVREPAREAADAGEALKEDAAGGEDGEGVPAVAPNRPQRAEQPQRAPLRPIQTERPLGARNDAINRNNVSVVASAAGAPKSTTNPSSRSRKRPASTTGRENAEVLSAQSHQEDALSGRSIAAVRRAHAKSDLALARLRQQRLEEERRLREAEERGRQLAQAEAEGRLLAQLERRQRRRQARWRANRRIYEGGCAATIQRHWRGFAVRRRLAGERGQEAVAAQVVGGAEDVVAAGKDAGEDAALDSGSANEDASLSEVLDVLPGDGPDEDGSRNVPEGNGNDGIGSNTGGNVLKGDNSNGDLTGDLFGSTAMVSSSRNGASTARASTSQTLDGANTLTDGFDANAPRSGDESEAEEGNASSGEESEHEETPKKKKRQARKKRSKGRSQPTQGEEGQQLPSNVAVWIKEQKLRSDKPPLNAATEAVLKEQVADLKANLMASDHSEAEAITEILRRRGKGDFSLAESQANGLVEKVLDDWRVKHFVTAADKKALTHGTTKDQWWRKRWAIALPLKSKSMPGKDNIKVGSVSTRAKASASGAAMDAQQKGLGLNVDFGDNTLRLLVLLEALRRKRCKTVRGNMTKTTARRIALQVLQHALQLLATKKGTTVTEVLRGMTLPQFINRHLQGGESLEDKAKAVARENADEEGLDDEDDDDANRLIQVMGSLRELNGETILVAYKNIVDGLVGGTIAAVQDKRGRWRLFVKVGEKIVREFCIGGGTVRHGFREDEYSRGMTTDGYYAMEMFSCPNSLDDCLVVDLNAQSDEDATDERHRKIPIPDTNRHARLVKVSRDKSKSMTTFELHFRDKDGKPCTITLHRLVVIVAEHHGFGIHHSERVRDKLGLKKGQTFEDLKRFQYMGKYSERSVEAMEAKARQLAKKGRSFETPTGCRTDWDHNVGRSEVWMNYNIFGIHCSHSFNQCMSIIRRFFGDWGFALGRIEYHSGND